MEEATEQQMRDRLSEELWRYKFKEFPSGSSKSIFSDSFDTIKIQLFALGLIRKSQKKHVPSDTNRYWSLTPYGEAMLMKVRAIPKSDESFLLSKPTEARERDASRSDRALGTRSGAV